MTDRHAGYWVVLEDDIREDDAEHVVNALRMVKGVAAVEPRMSSFEDAMVRERRDSSWRSALRELAFRGPG